LPLFRFSSGGENDQQQLRNGKRGEHFNFRFYRGILDEELIIFNWGQMKTEGTPFETFINNYLNSRWVIITWILVFIALTWLLQLLIPWPQEDDTAYHFVVGQLISKYGILHSFPWTPFSWQFDHYADKEFIFHLLFAFLGGLGFLTAERMVGTIAGTAILTSLYFVLRAEHVKLAGIWALLPLAFSAFLFRFALVRPHLLSISLSILLLWSLSRDKLRLAAIIAAIYPLTYVAFWQIPLILIIAVESARLLSGEPLRWRPAFTVFAGMFLGVAIHPNTLNLIKINWIHMSDILFQGAWGEREGINLALEFQPYSLEEWGRFLVITVLMTATAFVIAWKYRHKSSAPLSFTITAIIFALLTLMTYRFIEYFVPLSVLALALSMSAQKKEMVAPLVLVVALAYALLLGTAPYKILSSLETKNAYIDLSTASYFARQIPIGEQIFTTSWDFTGNLMLALPDRRFIVAADPTLFYKENPLLYEIWYNMVLSGPADSAAMIRKLFKSRFVISRNYTEYVKFFDAVRSDPGVKILFADERWVLYDLGQSSFQ
jgi:hypothetical protein